ncbi:uncharacterized protein LOC106638076 [Copidosoma floridanum]|uniref:uncharacterized protein LOC106638076 n=1 Tax=Copidosoma floridanum TaxID=29053 RepID=UPI0006C95022|nr:uncharacterized protein LOC106638076 [Copidosoma floridanum]
MLQTMPDMEGNMLRYKFFDHDSVLREYETIVRSLREELNVCKTEQNKLRLEMENLQKENQSTNDNIRHLLTDNNHENCDNVALNKEAVTNLEKRVTILQMEKESVFQLWQMALKAIDVLEEETKTFRREDKNVHIHQEQINNIKETYSDAIKVLESKLIEAKENFFQQQVLWEKSQDKIDQMTKERDDLLQQLNNFKQQISEKEKQHDAVVESLKVNLSCTKSELEQIKVLKIDLEHKLKDAQKFANTMLSKDIEAKSKVSEAVDLVESAVKERKEILQREAKVLEEKVKLETYLAKLSEEYAGRFERESLKTKETYNKNLKKYLLEIKELKAELKDRAILLDRSQREQRLLEEELERIRQGSDNFFQKTHAKVTNLQQKMCEKEYKSQPNKEGFKLIYDDKIQFLESQINHLQEKLSNTSDKLRRVNMQSCRDVEDHVREADDRTREIMDKCSNFERQLSRALIDKDNLASSLHALEVTFAKELQKRNQEKLLLENKIRNLQDRIVNPDTIFHESRIFSDGTSNRKNTDQQTLMNFDSMGNTLAIQEKYERKTKELTQLVETHQKLSNKWKEEANLLTSKFQKRTQEFRNKVNTLQKQNDDLTRELLFYQQLLARCNTQFIQNHKIDSEDR